MADRARGVASAAASRWSGRCRVLIALWLLFVPAQNQVAAQASARVSLQLAASVPEETGRRLVSAITGQLADLASVDQAPPNAGDPALCAVSIGPYADGLTLAFSDAEGRALGPRRTLSGADSERVASEAATIVRAFVVARIEGRASPSVARNEPAARTGAAAQVDAPDGGQVEQSSIPRQLDDLRSTDRTEATATEREPNDEKPAPSGAQPAPPKEPNKATAVVAPAADDVTAVPKSQASALGRLRFSALYTGSTYAPQLPWQSGLRAELALRLSNWLYGGLSYGFHPPVEVVGTLASVRIHDHNLSALASVGRMGSRFGLAGELVVGATDTLRTTTRTVSLLTSVRDAAYWSATVALRLRGRLRVPGLERFVLELSPVLEWVQRVRVSIAAGERDERILAPRNLRARLDVGLAVDVF